MLRGTLSVILSWARVCTLGPMAAPIRVRCITAYDMEVEHTIVSKVVCYIKVSGIKAKDRER